MSKLKTIDQWVEFAKENKYPWAEKFSENVKIRRSKINCELENWKKEYPRAETVEKKVVTATSLKFAVLAGQGHWEETPEGFEFWRTVYESLGENIGGGN
jgi:tRNA(Ile)-lysidine synthase TilS/MesJ